jgi:Protein of unknown function (DUF3089)
MDMLSFFTRHKWKFAAFALLLGTCALFLGKIAMYLQLYMITPSDAFEAYKPPEPPDYADPDSWAALPERPDSADVSIAGYSDRQEEAKVDVFFIHPTTFTSAEGWNQPEGHPESIQRLKNRILPGQASVFNGCCKVYAPHYRQATIVSFIDAKGNGQKALDLAFGDVVRAYEYFRENYNRQRPLIIAGHSQGAFHADRLLREVVSDDVIEKQLVAAYTVGFAISANDRLPVCASETQTGCQLNWNSQAKNAQTTLGNRDTICVNPLSWKNDDEYVSASMNAGSIDIAVSEEAEVNVADAQCENGVLIVSEINSENFKLLPFGPGNYHFYDFGLFYKSIKDNVNKRTAAFLAK